MEGEIRSIRQIVGRGRKFNKIWKRNYRFIYSVAQSHNKSLEIVMILTTTPKNFNRDQNSFNVECHKAERLPLTQENFN